MLMGYINVLIVSDITVIHLGILNMMNITHTHTHTLLTFNIKKNINVCLICIIAKDEFSWLVVKFPENTRILII